MTIKRLYNSPEWRKARVRFLMENPLCSVCLKMGKTVPATVVHHTTPHRGNPVIFWDETCWESVCSGCHNSILQIKDIHHFHQAAADDGFPLDPDHPWNK